MFSRIILLLCSLFITLNLYEGVFALNGQSYEDYKTTKDTFCSDSTKPWSTDNRLVPEIEYPELSDTAVNATLATWRDNTPRWMVGDEKVRLRSDLDPVRIGDFSGFKALEVVRIGYRSNMNSLFACGIVSSRLDTLKNLQDLVSSKLKNKNSEILQKLKQESNRLEQTVNTLKCNISAERKEMMVSLTHTAMQQYCEYRYYLGYLQSNIDANIRDVQEIEKKIGT